MKIKCPKCKDNAELTPDFSLVTCTKCNLEISYGEYIKHIINSPQKIIAFNLDGILEIFLSLGQSNKETISISIQNAIKSLDQNSKRKLVLLIPENAKNIIGF